MSWKSLLMALVLLAVAAPFVPGASAWTCVPAEDRGARPVPAATTTYYLRTIGNAGYTVVELWQETNGEKGLQLAPGMSCSDKADRHVEAICIGLCPISL